VRRVEVSVDNGTSWPEAVLQKPVLRKCLTRFRLPWRWTGAPAKLSSRATDEDGNIQPTRSALIEARGDRGRYHYNAIQSWAVSADGRLTNAS
jgi:sulfane dehydrogenase subunit SoxC